MDFYALPMEAGQDRPENEALFQEALFQYGKQTLAWRLKATRDLESASANAANIAWAVRHSIAELAYGLSGRTWNHVNNARYYSGLMVSYLRTHMTVMDMALTSEVSDGTTLLRKQLELVARLRELDHVDDASTLLGKVPNLRHLRTNARSLYGGYSEVAHVSAIQVFELLGRGDGDNSGFTSIHPKFTTNSLILLQNAAVIHVEFLDWAIPFLQSNRLGCDEDQQERLNWLISALIEWRIES